MLFGAMHLYSAFETFLIQPFLNNKAKIFFLIGWETIQSNSCCLKLSLIPYLEKNKAYALNPYWGISDIMVT